MIRSRVAVPLRERTVFALADIALVVQYRYEVVEVVEEVRTTDDRCAHDGVTSVRHVRQVRQVRRMRM